MLTPISPSPNVAAGTPPSTGMPRAAMGSAMPGAVTAGSRRTTAPLSPCNTPLRFSVHRRLFTPSGMRLAPIQPCKNLE